MWREIYENQLGQGDAFTEQVIRPTQGFGAEALPFQRSTEPTQGAGVVSTPAEWARDVLRPGSGSSALPFS